MNEAIESGPETEEYWKNHVLTAQSFMGTDAEYCRRNGLDQKAFHWRKMKYGLKPRRYRPRAFVKVETESAKDVEGRRAASPTRRTEPDPKWLATFVKALWNEQ